MLEELKKITCDAAKRAQEDHLCIHKSGNFSMRDKESGYVVMTPSGVDRITLDYHDLLVMDITGKVIENTANLLPSSESLMHLTLYQQRNDVYAIAHTHSNYATVFAILNKPIPAIVYECGVLNLTKGSIPVAPYGRPGTKALADSVMDVCHEADVFLLEKHGVVAVGSDMEDTYVKALYVEEIAKLYHLALDVSGGQEIASFTQAELDGWEYPSDIQL